MTTRIYDAICNTLWAMQEDDVRAILEIASREHQIDPQAVAAMMGKPLDNKSIVTLRGNTAVLPITGPIFRRANLFQSISGATSLDIMAIEFNKALNDPTIESILLDIDSPGGEVNGTGEFANMIYAARDKKPIWAYISNLGTSAAYWIGSAASHVVIAPSAMAGNIGVVSVLRKPDPDSKAKTVEIVSSQSPNKRVNVNKEEDRAKVQAIVDSMADVFIGDVARNRNVSTDTVIEQYGAGGISVGLNAVKCGLVDEVGSFESCIARMRALNNPPLDVTVSGPVDSSTATALGNQLAKAVSGYINPNHGSTIWGGKLSGKPLSERWDALKQFILQGEEMESNETNTLSNTASSTNVDEQPVPTPATAKAIALDEVSALKAEVKRLRVERWQAEATAFADRHIAEGRAFPAEREALVKFFIQASYDDHTFGSTDDGSSRVSMLTAIYGQRPQHQLTAEGLAPALADILRNAPSQRGMSQNDERPLTQTEVNELLGKTPLGKSVLNKINGVK